MRENYRKIEHMSWDDIHSDMHQNATTSSVLQDTSFDAVIGIMRGGLPIAILFSHFFNIPLGVIDVRGFDPKNPDSPYRRANGLLLPCTLERDSKILVVDDILDRGNTLQAAAFFLKPASLFAYCAVSKIPKKELSKKFRFPILYGREIPSDAWVTFPWEVF